MASDQQIAANRRNALYSRGPKTAEGRARSRRNALKHGLTARSLILEGERAAQYEAFRTELVTTYAPQGLIEEQLVDVMSGLLWRLRRVPALEAAAFAWMQRCHQRHPLTDEPDSEGRRRGKERGRLKREDLGRAVFHLVRDGDIIDKLNRYETHLILHLGRVAAQLERTHVSRRDADGRSAPLATSPAPTSDGDRD